MFTEHFLCTEHCFDCSASGVNNKDPALIKLTFCGRDDASGEKKLRIINGTGEGLGLISHSLTDLFFCLASHTQGPHAGNEPWSPSGPWASPPLESLGWHQMEHMDQASGTRCSLPPGARVQDCKGEAKTTRSTQELRPLVIIKGCISKA